MSEDHFWIRAFLELQRLEKQKGARVRLDRPVILRKKDVLDAIERAKKEKPWTPND